MRTAVVVTPEFAEIWPFAADRISQLLSPVTEVEHVQQRLGETVPLAESITDPATVERVFALGVGITADDLAAMPLLREAAVSHGYRPSDDQGELLAAHGIRQLRHTSEGFWGQSVAEFALGLTIAALRRIPQRHGAVITGNGAWVYEAQQYSDDSRFSNGTIAGKRVRIVGAGNIASRYASFVHALGADVAAWDPYALEPAFHRTGARREHLLDRLVDDAEIFVPMVPLTPETEGLVTAEQLRALPVGCLVVQVTRARIVDTDELRRRVLADELSLAADVFDTEPLDLADPLIGRSNVVHTPHIAGRTRDANHRWAEALVEQCAEYEPRHAPAPPPLPRISD